MSFAAKEWDEKHGNSVSHHVIEGDRFLPVNRPCDWCGLVVAKGWIHPKCAKEERELFLDIL